MVLRRVAAHKFRRSPSAGSREQSVSPPARTHRMLQGLSSHHRTRQPSFTPRCAATSGWPSPPPSPSSPGPTCGSTSPTHHDPTSETGPPLPGKYYRRSTSGGPAPQRGGDSEASSDSVKEDVGTVGPSVARAKPAEPASSTPPLSRTTFACTLNEASALSSERCQTKNVLQLC